MGGEGRLHIIALKQTAVGVNVPQLAVGVEGAAKDDLDGADGGEAVRRAIVSGGRAAARLVIVVRLVGEARRITSRRAVERAVGEVRSKAELGPEHSTHL